LTGSIDELIMAASESFDLSGALNFDNRQNKSIFARCYLAELLTKTTQPAAESEPAQASEYQTRLSQVLSRIDNASTHYQMLALEQTATYEQVLQAYHTTLALLYPSYQLRNALEEKLLERMDAAFSKLSWAFSILANFKKRADYHIYVLSSAKPPNAAQTSPGQRKPATSTLQAISEARKTTGTHPALAQASGSGQPAGSRRSPSKEMTVTGGLGAKAVYSEFSGALKDDNRRRSQRFKLSVPARVAGFDRVGNKWHEMTQSADVSRTGVTLQLRKRVRQNTVVHLTMPLPTKLRTHGFADNSFSTYALVRRVEPPKNGERVVALEFIGEHPPAGFLEKPWATFRPGKWAGQERRRNRRENRVEKIRVEYFNDALASLGSEDTFSENMSQTGMRLFVKNAPFEFDLVRITFLARKFETLAAVRNRYVAKDGTERLCLHFINSSQLPL
jgi:hypothetical protein